MKKVLLVLVGVVVGVGSYIVFDKVITPDAVVIEAVEGDVLYKGTFMDADPAHKAQGNFYIVADGMGGRKIMLSNDFMVANAPDPHVKINGVLIAKNHWKGGQVFNIPNFIDEKINEVLIWCEIAGVNLAVSSFVDGELPTGKTFNIPEKASEALIVLGTMGKAEMFAKENGGKSYGKVSGAFLGTPGEALSMEEMEMNAGFFGFAPEAAVVDGWTYRMVAPVIVKDNFVVYDDNGWFRFDLGIDEGTNIVTVVATGERMKK